MRTSPATTAKPRPSSPARAASTAALSARMLVWNAMPSMVEMMSPIFWELSVMARTESTMALTASLLSPAICAALDARPLARSAWSAFWRTVTESSSMLAAVSCSAAACSSVRCDRSVLPWAICVAAADTCSLFERMPEIMPTSWACMVFMA